MREAIRKSGGGAVTDLERVIAGLQEYRVKIDVAIGALRELGPGANGHAAELPAPEQRQLPTPRSKGRAKAKPVARGNGKVDWELGRKLWVEGVSTVEIAKRLGVSRAAPLYRAKVDKWPKREAPRVNPEPAAAPAPVATAAPIAQPVKDKPRPIAVPRPAAPKQEEKKGKVALRRCDHCSLVTDEDPCKHCGHPMQEWRSVFS